MTFACILTTKPCKLSHKVMNLFILDKFSSIKKSNFARFCHLSLKIYNFHSKFCQKNSILKIGKEKNYTYLCAQNN